uniref:Putative endodeoxyribonuclease n=1 Tax=viral metagenome TaxID=1070528 RepID=A0A6M3LIP7_9ZZZZ
MKIIIPGKPIAKARPRFVRRGKHVITFNPQETEEGKWLLSARGQIPKPIEGPIEMFCEFVFDRPKSHFGTEKNSDKLKPSAPYFHTNKIDVDNLLKFCNDCLNGEAYKDDCQIVELTGIKRWANEGESAKTIISMLALEEP